MSNRFSHRSGEEEIMDDLDCSGEVVDQTLRELDTINRLLGGNNVTLQGIDKLLKDTPREKKITISDLGCGGGDIIEAIAAWGDQNNRTLQLTGIDANPNIIAFAKSTHVIRQNIQFETLNIFSDEFRNRKSDIVLATLFTHHFSEEQLIGLLKGLKASTQIGIVINDLHRHWLAFYSITLLTRIFSKSKMVKFDAPLSVLRAFRRAELEDILKKAGITRYALKWRWAFRWQLIIPAGH